MPDRHLLQCDSGVESCEQSDRTTRRGEQGEVKMVGRSGSIYLRRRRIVDGKSGRGSTGPAGLALVIRPYVPLLFSQSLMPAQLAPSHRPLMSTCTFPAPARIISMLPAIVSGDFASKLL